MDAASTVEWTRTGRDDDISREGTSAEPAEMEMDAARSGPKGSTLAVTDNQTVW